MLSQHLVAGQKYYASLKVAFTGFSCATNKMGISFSTVPFDSLNPPPVNDAAFVYTDSMISETANWYQIKGSFTADSNYSYIIIGNFFTGVGCPAGTYESYYYVDDVCLSTDSSSCYSTVGIEAVKDNTSIDLYPDPFVNELNVRSDYGGISEITLYDIMARPVMRTSFENAVSLNTAQLAKGIYIYEVRNKNSLIGKGKVVKE